MAGSGAVSAPEFPAGLAWLNTGRPLNLHELRGKVVLLDFWTYCCINCMHVIPDLKRLEAEFADELVVIGVHSAKFTAEQQTENIRQAILRYGIEHAVVNDRDMEVWDLYGVRAWPTAVLIDPAGKIAAPPRSGEGVYDAYAGAIRDLVAQFDARGLMDRKRLRLVGEEQAPPATGLSFPGKVLADEASGRLFVADSNHNRILVVALSDGSLLDTIGGGAEGLVDGPFEQAAFRHPQGMALDGDRLYIADTENHVIRLADLRERTVTTIAGTGEQGHYLDGSAPGRTTALTSPWDLVLHDGGLYIAMAGAHQIWRLAPPRAVLEAHAGSGREARWDGSLLGAALAQPSGITTDGRRLYFADSEVSAIRSADLDGAKRVDTIAGGDLFDFGDVDAVGLQARFQHPLGIAYHEGALYVADTYNNKIKRIAIDERRSETFLGTGEAGLRDGAEAAFDEPGGVSIAGGKLYVADTGNHAVRVADLASRRVGTLQIKGLQAPAAPAPRRTGPEAVELPAQAVRAGQVELVIEVDLPAGQKLTPDAPSSVSLETTDESVLAGVPAKPVTLGDVRLSLSLRARAGHTELTADFAVYHCESDDAGLCYISGGRVRIPIEVRDGAESDHVIIQFATNAP